MRGAAGGGVGKFAAIGGAEAEFGWTGAGWELVERGNPLLAHARLLLLLLLLRRRASREKPGIGYLYLFFINYYYYYARITV